ncbi:MAG TPA: ADOP family duplicated permease [Vicinamibacterales bacterium]
MLDALKRDTRLALRSLLRSPGFTIPAALTLAIGIGGTALMLTTADTAFRRDLAFGNADRLVHVWQVSPRNNQVNIPLQVARDWQAEVRSFDSYGLSLGTGPTNVTNMADAERVIASVVNRDFFRTLGVNPAMGRTFSVEESAPNGPVAALISDSLWERLFGRAPDVLQRTIQIEGVPYPIAGVMPAGFSYPLTTELWTNFERRAADFGDSRTAHNFEVIARLAPGVGLLQAQTEIERVTSSLQARDAEMRNEGYAVRLSDLRADLLGDGRTAFALLAAAVACVLLIACANVANLLLARATTRRAQSTLRIALGASAADVVRLFIVESVVLAVMAAVGGGVMVVWAASLVEGLLPEGALPPGAVMPDLRVIAGCAAVTLFTGIACGLPSAIHSARANLRDAIAGASRSLSGEPRGMRWLTAIEVALAAILLVGAGLLLRGLGRLEVVDPGFSAENVLISPLVLGSSPGSIYEDAARRTRFLDQVLERTRAVPGTAQAGITSSAPFTFSPNALLEEEGVPPGQWGKAPATEYRVIGGDYFQALGVPLKAGRLFGDDDAAGAPLVAIVNEATASILWQGGPALGRRVRMANMDRITDFATIVGVVGNVRHRGLTRPVSSEIFFPYRQRPMRTWSTSLLVKPAIAPASVVEGLRAAIRETDRSIPPAFSALSDRVDVQVRPARFRARVLAAIAAAALLLAAVGLFAVISYSVARRTREIGIRIALGASPALVQRLIVLRGMLPVAVGTIAGGWIALLFARSLGALVFDISPRDPWTFAGVAIVLLATGLAATWLPAARATRIDPTVTLRAD